MESENAGCEQSPDYYSGSLLRSDSPPQTPPPDVIRNFHVALQSYLQQLPLSLFQKEELANLISEEVDANIAILEHGKQKLDVKQQEKNRFDILVKAAWLRGEITIDLSQETMNQLLLQAPDVSGPKELTAVRKSLRGNWAKKIKKWYMEENITFPLKTGTFADPSERTNRPPIPLGARKKAIHWGGVGGAGAFCPKELAEVGAALLNTTVEILEIKKRDLDEKFLTWVNNIGNKVAGNDLKERKKMVPPPSPLLSTEEVPKNPLDDPEPDPKKHKSV